MNDYFPCRVLQKVSKDVCSDPSGFSRIKQETMERILWEGGKGDEGGRLKGGRSPAKWDNNKKERIFLKPQSNKRWSGVWWEKVDANVWETTAACWALLTQATQHSRQCNAMMQINTCTHLSVKSMLQIHGCVSRTNCIWLKRSLQGKATSHTAPPLLA